MGLMEAWLNAAVRGVSSSGRSLTDIAEETGLSESEVLYREVEMKSDPTVCGGPIRYVGKQSDAALIARPSR